MSDICTIISEDICLRVYLEGRYCSSFVRRRGAARHDEYPERAHLMLQAVVDNVVVCPFCSATLTPIHSVTGSFDGASSKKEDQDPAW